MFFVRTFCISTIETPARTAIGIVRHGVDGFTLLPTSCVSKNHGTRETGMACNLTNSLHIELYGLGDVGFGEDAAVGNACCAYGSIANGAYTTGRNVLHIETRRGIVCLRFVEEVVAVVIIPVVYADRNFRAELNADQ